MNFGTKQNQNSNKKSNNKSAFNFDMLKQKPTSTEP